MIDKATQQKIKDAADIVDVVSDYVNLSRRGRNYMGLCPFHNERTPSFSVNTSKNICWCFSCKKGGSPVNFLMLKEGYTYYEALRQLAKRYNITIEERELTDEEKERMQEREAMTLANEWAMKKMESDLFDTEEGRAVGLSYFRERGVTDEALKAFHLGYAPEESQWLVNSARKAGFDLTPFISVGLIGKNTNGNYYDRYRGRVIFPIFTSGMRVVGFGGRTLRRDMAKYINSPESEIYKKSNELYGLAQAKETINKEQKCFLVEGYMDVIGMWQSGMKNVVASSGTALTERQIGLIKRFTNNITLVYDGDAPGIKAALRGADMLLKEGMHTRVLLLPDGEDPDSFARKHTPEEFKAYVDAHESDVIHFKAKVLMDETTSDPLKKGEAVRSIVQSIAVVPDIIQRDIYIQECSKLTGISRDTIANAVADAVRSASANERKANNKRDLENFIARENHVQNPSNPNSTQAAGAEIQTYNTTKDVDRPSEDTPQGSSASVSANSNLQRVEKPIVTYLVKYGMLTAGVVKTQNSDGTESEIEVKVWEYIREEIINDNLSFSVAVFSRLYEKVMQLIEDYNQEWELASHKIEREIEELRNKGIEEIALKNLDMRAIAREEEQLETYLATIRESKKKEYDRNYLEIKLSSEEDDEVRTFVTGIIESEYRLSNIYVKNGNAERDEERLSVIVPRAVIEWKTELLENRLKSLMDQFSKIDPTEEQTIMQLQREVRDITLLRAEIAKTLGDRILSPRVK